MRKLLFGITSLGLGGAERVLVDTANKLSEKFDVTIFSIYDHGELKQDLNSNVKFKSMYDCSYNELSKLQKMWIPIKILLFSKFIYHTKIKADYDTEIAFLEGPITRLFSTKNEKAKKIAWIHNDIDKVFGNNFKSKLKKYIDKSIYTKYNELVFVSKDNLEKFQNVYNAMDGTNMHVIYNYLDADLVRKKAEAVPEIQFDISGKNFLSVCRLVEQKAIDRFIRVHSKLIKQGLKHKVYIVGEGPERPKLEALIKKEHVERTFILLGKKSNPYPYIKMADYFCLLSEFEGYGMVLDEAKILGKKIIITNTAARESVEHYKNAMVLENSESEIYDGLYKLLKDDEFLPSECENFEKENQDKINKIIELVGE